MRTHALACDYDGTLASDGELGAAAREALAALRGSGRKLIVVTGRQVDDLQRVCPDLELFDRVVGENGGVLYDPATRDVRPLAEPPPAAFVGALRERAVEPLSVGRVIVATWRPEEAAVRGVIRALGLELQIIFNKGALMVLPSGVDKATGLEAALRELGLAAQDTVGVGDAENDLAFLARCGRAVAVANALPCVKARADLVTAEPAGAGVAALARGLLAEDR